MSDLDQTPHPNSPAGGGGPGGFRGAAPLGADKHNWAASHPSAELTTLNTRISAASNGHPGWSLDPRPAMDAVMSVLGSGLWKDLESYAERVLAPGSFELGVLFGLTEAVASGIESLLSLLKMVVLEGLYEQLHYPPEKWYSPLWANYAEARVVELAVGDPSLNQAHVQCKALFDEVTKIMEDPKKFLTALGQKFVDQYAFKWEECQKQMSQRTLLGDFQAGRITGHVLLDVIMLLLTVWGAAEAVARVAGEIPEMLNVVKGLSGAKDALQVEKATAVAAGAEDVDDLAAVARKGPPSVEPAEPALPPKPVGPQLRPDLDPKWVDTSGNPKWPPNNGAAGPEQPAVLAKGTVIDRYGGEGGSFASEPTASYSARALPYDPATIPYHQYEVLKPLPTMSSEAAPWFDQAGGAPQYRFDKSVRDLVNEGYLKPIK